MLHFFLFLIANSSYLSLNSLFKSLDLFFIVYKGSLIVSFFTSFYLYLYLYPSPPPSLSLSHTLFLFCFIYLFLFLSLFLSLFFVSFIFDLDIFSSIILAFSRPMSSCVLLYSVSANPSLGWGLRNFPGGAWRFFLLPKFAFGGGASGPISHFHSDCRF